ncbi:hypothetical protein [Lewinella sp. JB7]|uniref:hypothetical protein n=1 Tax=Lewinella sp. JB7 TaxID=2962887 RepID=UPI0020CA0A8C|nr:hypothetical protein [Lewinella sp. JB7]MCP9234832.1 hypothetical protein [Lewinella sp. JB7]
MRHVCLLILSAVLCSGFLSAQEEAPPGPLYYQITKLHHSGGNLMDVETRQMLPYFQARINEGSQVWHGLYRLESPTGRQADFDYVSVDIFTNLTDMNLPAAGQNMIIDSIFPHATPQEFWARVEEVSTVQSVETFMSVGGLPAGVGVPAQGEPQLIAVNYMRVLPGMEAEYLAMENDMFRPIMEIHRGAENMQNWTVFQRVLPDGTDFGANFATVDAFTDWAQMEAYEQNFFAAAEKAHPNRDFSQIAERLVELRELRRKEVWKLVSEATPAATEEITYRVVKEGTGPKPLRGQEVTWSGKVMNADGETLFATSNLSDNWQWCVGCDPYLPIWNEAVMMVGEGGIVETTVPVSRQSYDERRSNGGSVAVQRLTVHKVGPPVNYGHDKLREMLGEHGLEATKQWYAGLKRDNPEGYVFREMQMNNLGYQLMAEGKKEEAIYVLDLNCKNYPDSFNTYDSLADAYSNAGDDYHAKQNFEMALQKNPESSFTAEKLSKLK